MAWDNLEKTGFPNGGWIYNENNMNYNQDLDADTGVDVDYNLLGDPDTWININKT